MQQLLQQALASIVPAALLEALLARALKLGGAPPDGGEELLEYIDGPLRVAIAEQFGDQLARLGARHVRKALADHLPVNAEIIRAGSMKPVKPDCQREPFAERETRSSAHPQVVFAAETRPMLWPGTGSLVLVSQDHDAATRLAELLKVTTKVVSVDHFSSNTSTLKPLLSNPSTVVVFDCRTSDPETLGLQRSPDWTAGLTILWGDGEDLGEASQLVSERREWILCSREAEPRDLRLLVEAFHLNADNA